jgi:hypothetical protein
MFPVRTAIHSRGLACSEKTNLSKYLYVWCSVSTQTTPNCNTNLYLAVWFQLLLVLVALACVALAEPQGTPVVPAVPGVPADQPRPYGRPYGRPHGRYYGRDRRPDNDGRRGYGRRPVVPPIPLGGGNGGVGVVGPGAPAPIG